LTCDIQTLMLSTKTTSKQALHFNSIITILSPTALYMQQMPLAY